MVLAFNNNLTGGNFGAVNVGRHIQLTANRTGLLGEYLIGRDAVTSIPNSADPTKPLSALGTHTYAARKDTVAGLLNYYETGLADPADLTVLMIASAANNCQYMGSFTGANGTDATTMIKATSGLQVQTSNSDNTNSTTTVQTIFGTAAEPRGVAVRLSGSADYVVKSDQFKGGVKVTGVSETKTGKTRKLSSTTLRIGAPATGASYIGSVDFLAGFVWSRALSDAELLAVYQEAFAFYADLGIAI